MEFSKNKLFMAFIIITVIKIILSLLVSTPTIYTDEYIYMKLAQSLYQNLELSIHNISVSIYPPLYSLILSLSYVFEDASLAYIGINKHAGEDIGLFDTVITSNDQIENQSKYAKQKTHI